MHTHMPADTLRNRNTDTEKKCGLNARAHTDTHTQTHTHRHTQTHTHTQRDIHTQTHTETYTHRHTQTYTRGLEFPGWKLAYQVEGYLSTVSPPRPESWYLSPGLMAEKYGDWESSGLQALFPKQKALSNFEQVMSACL